MIGDDEMTVNIALAGPRGKMGSEAIKMILNEPSFKLVGLIDRKNDRQLIKEKSPAINDDVKIFQNINTCFESIDVDVLVDLTIPEVGYTHTEAAIKHNVRAVVGTSGFSDDQVKVLKKLAKEKK